MMKSRLLVAAGTFLLMAGASGAAAARDTAVDLFEFDGASGYAPDGGVVADSTGTVFGTAPIGGNGSCDGGAGCGTIYALSPPSGGSKSWTLNVLYNFQNQGDGWFPAAQLTLGPKGSLYGYPSAGSYGTVFQLLPANGSTWTYNVLYTFTGGADGNLLYVSAPLVRHDGALYGIASGGSNTCSRGCGSVFQLTPPQSGNGSWTETTLYSFTGGATSGEPNSIVGFGSDKALYIATLLDNGAVVQIARSGGRWKETVLTAFQGGQDGYNPSSLVLAADGTLYGIASRPTGGFAFHLTPGNSGWTRTGIAEIKHNHYGPTSLSAGANGTLIGTIWGDVDFFSGNAFQLTPPVSGGGKWTYSELWNFNRGPDRNPVNVVTGRGGHPFGVLNGGDSGNGALFELK